MRPVVPGAQPFSPLTPGQADNPLTAPPTPQRRTVQVDRSKVDPKLVEVGEGMEAMFLDYMMKVMRQTVPKNDMDLESPATEIYRSMLDSEMAQKAAKSGGFGLADQVIAYLDSQRYTLPRGRNGSGQTQDQTQDQTLGKYESTGGTRERIEGQPARQSTGPEL